MWPWRGNVKLKYGYKNANKTNARNICAWKKKQILR